MPSPRNHQGPSYQWKTAAAESVMKEDIGPRIAKERGNNISNMNHLLPPLWFPSSNVRDHEEDKVGDTQPKQLLQKTDNPRPNPIMTIQVEGHSLFIFFGGHRCHIFYDHCRDRSKTSKFSLFWQNSNMGTYYLAYHWLVS